MSKKSTVILSVIALAVSVMSGITFYNNKIINMSNETNSTQKTITENPKLNTHDYAKNIVKPKDKQPIKSFILVAQESTKYLTKEVSMPVWTFNGTVPGPEIRVTQGDFVRVTLKNFLKDPVTIHWHGYPLNSAMDGVPGWNQDAVKSGETFTYEFSADVPGTYWYHSHQEGANQVDRGLYGALIVEPKDKEKVDKDYTLMIDEWMEKPMNEMDSMGSMSDKKNTTDNEKMSKEEQLSLSEEESMASMYNIYTINGKSKELIDPIEAKKGDVVRLRFINAGYRSHGIHVPGQNIKVVSTDGQDISGAEVVEDQIVNIAPGERYDIEFTIDDEKNFTIDFHDKNKYNDQIKIPVKVLNASGTLSEDSNIQLKDFNLFSYGKLESSNFTLNQKYDEEYNIDLGVKVEGQDLKYVLNGQAFSELPVLKLKKDHSIKITYTNKSNVDHPMHLHGHFFQVIASNGKELTGAAIMKDTLLIKPGESYTIAFKADNPGRWVQHCHELHHAAAGMMQKIEYDGFVSNYTPNPKDTFNKPE